MFRASDFPTICYWQLEMESLIYLNPWHESSSMLSRMAANFPHKSGTIFQCKGLN
jgi:hypothetical protein